MKIEYEFRIFPWLGKIRAEIYHINPIADKMELHDISKEFGSIFRKPIESDYIEARAWALSQLEYLNEANK